MNYLSVCRQAEQAGREVSSSCDPAVSRSPPLPPPSPLDERIQTDVSSVLFDPSR